MVVLFKFGKNGFLVAQSRGSENLSLCEVVPCVHMHIWIGKWIEIDKQ